MFISSLSSWADNLMQQQNARMALVAYETCFQCSTMCHFVFNRKHLLYSAAGLLFVALNTICCFQVEETTEPGVLSSAQPGKAAA